MKKTAITCTRRIEFDAAHRVMEHESKCKHLHGHRYALEVTFATDGLDALGRVIDFSLIKQRLGDWILKHWDHATILSHQDKPLGEAIGTKTGQTIFYLPANPTAENMASYLLTEICPDLFKDMGVRCTRVRLYETPACYVDALA